MVLPMKWFCWEYPYLQHIHCCNKQSFQLISTFGTPNSSLALLLSLLASRSVFYFVLHVRYFMNVNYGGYLRQQPTLFDLNVFCTGQFSFHNNMYRSPRFQDFISERNGLFCNTCWLIFSFYLMCYQCPRSISLAFFCL